MDRVTFEAPLKFRIQGQSVWYSGSTVNVSSTDVLIHCSNIVQIGTELELFLVPRDEQQNEQPPITTCLGRVVQTVIPKSSGQQPAMAVQFHESE
jgi:hypothetical protein